MARKKMAKNPQVEDYRHEDEKRKNIPPVGLAASGGIPKTVQWKLDL